MRTWSPAVGMSAVNCSPARGNGNTGSLSENATSTGLSQLANASRTARISAAPTSSSDVGTRNGNLWAPALLSVVG